MSLYHAPALHADINSSPYTPSTHQEAQGIGAPSKGLRVHSMHKGDETGGTPLSQGDTMPLSMCVPHQKPLIALLQRFRSCTRASILMLGAYT